MPKVSLILNEAEANAVRDRLGLFRHDELVESVRRVLEEGIVQAFGGIGGGQERMKWHEQRRIRYQEDIVALLDAISLVRPMKHQSERAKDLFDAVDDSIEQCTSFRYGLPHVHCGVCHRPKNPIGRDVGAAAANGYCDYDCAGFKEGEQPDHLFPGEVGFE